ISSSMSTRRRFSARNTRRTSSSARGEVRWAQSPGSMSAAAKAAWSWGPAPWTTTGWRPTWWRKLSEEARLSMSSASKPPPTLMTAKRLCSTLENCLRYCSTSLRPPRLRRSLTISSRDLGMAMGASGQDRAVAGGGLGEVGERDVFAGGVRLVDGTWPIDQGDAAGGGEQGGLGPEIDRVARREAEAGGEGLGVSAGAGEPG